ncbi:MAG TPA: PKD domain-containing protein [Phycisphaerae bacterium]|nr:PKD domain-containing protein [Phycisphaerae bacterium]
MQTPGPDHGLRRAQTLRRLATVSLLSGLALLCCGCPALETLPSQAKVHEETDEQSRRQYLLYVPSTYSDKHAWPLIVACHGTWPYDTAELQMREWAKFAEDSGIIVIAPKLVGTKGDFPPPPEEQIALQREDEKAILGAVSAVKLRYNIAENEVFMTGWSAGGYAILNTGLRNPDVFRALAIRQSSFDERFMDVPRDQVDPWQKVLVIYGVSDLLREQSMALLKWLWAAGIHPDEREITGSHRRIDPAVPWKYFREVAKKSPWVRIRATPTGGAKRLEMRFDLDALPKAVKQKWFFGDGTDSHDAAPTHAYAEPGRYEVTVNVALQDGKKYSRKKIVSVGRVD